MHMVIGTSAGIHLMADFTFRGKELIAWICKHTSPEGCYYRCNVLPSNYYVSIKRNEKREHEWVNKETGSSDELVAELGKIVEENESRIV